MSADGDHAQETNDVDFDDDTDNQDDIVEDEGPRTTLQAAIAWIMTRDSEPTFSLAETELDKIGELILRAGVAPKMPAQAFSRSERSGSRGAGARRRHRRQLDRGGE